ncbi:phosphatidylinositol glycan [Cavenderia fasciculata]|uniref:N-acetylglucosaminylphosphatidylinositol deacetylase n=1 Tax=Cavenderia fasciculata TaxID=261658 RepID=F4QCM5_CACFS|nr:phosphatidylinositol glycan [Cavenderia fasciculata]EGG14453.1 phosphatidylinositol glycan [Cavenderia fasciculata]|eukprot:XP_004353862.1 phosphatidylinositol glycan [Cavenderia fasciculata]
MKVVLVCSSLFILLLAYLFITFINQEDSGGNTINQEKEQGDMTTTPTTRILLAIAHPDDECMFFSPTLEYYQSIQGEESIVHVVCLSNGNADGLGKIREKELVNSCRCYGVARDHVAVVNDTNLPDGMDKDWDVTVISKYIQKYVDQWGITQILTFDHGGVSGHPNHISVSNGVKLYLKNNTKVKGYELESVNIIRKYIGIGDVFFSKWIFSSYDRLYTAYKLFGKNFEAMKQHASQLVWFRYLFVLFSRYSYCNTLVEIKQD